MATLAYYWTSRREDLRDGFTIQGEALGCSCGDAIERAGALNLQLDAWRRGRALAKASILDPALVRSLGFSSAIADHQPLPV